MDFRSLLGAAHSRLPWYREVPRQGPACSRLPRQKRVLGEDFAADRVELLGGEYRAAVHQVTVLRGPGPVLHITKYFKLSFCLRFITKIRTT